MEKEVHVSTAAAITQLSSLTCDPRRVFSRPPWALCFLPLSSSLVFTWTRHCCTKDLVCHQNRRSSGANGGGGAEGRELRQCPPPKSLNSDVSYQLHPYGDAQRQMKRDRHWLALYFSCGDISFVVFLTEPTFIPALRWDKDLVDKSMSIPVGTLKDCRCHVHNKGKETTTYSNYIFKVSGFKLS